MAQPDPLVPDPNPIIREVEATKNSLSTDQRDFSFGELMNMYDEGEIIIAPEYQRLFRWSNEQKTSFIESILLGIPIPPIFVAEDKDGVWELIDGLQRISTVFSFFGVLRDSADKNNWALEEGDLIKKIKGENIHSLPQKLKLNIKRAGCRVEIVKWNSKMDLRYELFNRLNTGGSPLTEQEIRNCIFRGISTKFNEFLTVNAERTDFTSLIEPTHKQFEEKYLEELVLRFVALHVSGLKVSKSIAKFLTEFMKESVEKDSLNFSELQTLFDRVIRVLSPIGRDVFRAKNGIFSPSLYDGIMIGTAQYIDAFEADADLLEIKIDNLKNSKVFENYTGSASSSKERVMGRVRTAIEIFNPV